MTFQEFIEQHENQALEIDIKKLQPGAFSKYLDRKFQLENADFESETIKAIDEVKESISFFKRKVLNVIKNDHIKTKYIGMTPPYLEHLRLYLMYKQLHSVYGELTQKPELSLRQVALLYIYKRDQITGENHNGIAKEYGHKSGHKLKQFYDAFNQTNSRKSSGSKRKDKKLFNDIEKIIEYLPIEKQEKPKTEAEFLRSIVQNNDYTSL